MVNTRSRSYQIPRLMREREEERVIAYHRSKLVFGAVMATSLLIAFVAVVVCAVRLDWGFLSIGLWSIVSAIAVGLVSWASSEIYYAVAMWWQVDSKA